MARKRNIYGSFTIILVLSLLLSVIAQVSGMVSTKYIAPPKFTGCATVYKDTFSLFYGLIFLLSLIVGLILLGTYCFLSKHLNKVITTSKEVQTLKRGALLVTQLTAGSFFIAYLPIVILFVTFTADSNLLSKIKAPYLMCLDFLVRLVFHLNSCVIPTFLVTSRALSAMKTAANVSRNRSMRYIQTCQN